MKTIIIVLFLCYPLIVFGGDYQTYNSNPMLRDFHKQLDEMSREDARRTERIWDDWVRGSGNNNNIYEYFRDRERERQERETDRRLRECEDKLRQEERSGW